MPEGREDGRRRTGKRMLRPGLEEASATAAEWLKTETSGGGCFASKGGPKATSYATIMTYPKLLYNCSIPRTTLTYSAYVAKNSSEMQIHDSMVR